MRRVRSYGYGVLALLLSVVLPACTAQVAESPSPAAVPTETASPAAALPTRAVPPVPNAMPFVSPTFVPDPTTAVVTYRPPAGLPERAVEGSCPAMSQTLNRRGVWRCTAGGITYEPCFVVEAAPRSVWCVADPARAQATAIHLSSPLPEDNRPATPTGKAWAFAMADGSSCAPAAGATFMMEGERLTYQCSDGWVVFGQPAPGTLWTVTKTKLKSDNSLEQTLPVQIATVWQ